MKVTTERRTFATPGEVVDAVTAVVHRPGRRHRPAFLLVPGAGGDLDGGGLVGLCDALAGQGHLVVRANLPYREAGRASPPRANRAVPGLVALATSVRGLAPRTPWVVGGKSYGGRVASMAAAGGLETAAAGGLETAGLLLYGYPLHPPGRTDRLRTDHWPDIAVPCLFLQGDHDAFGTPELLEEHLRRLPRRARVHVVKGGDHSLKVTSRHAPDGLARSAGTVTGELGRMVDSWVQDAIG